MTRLERLSSFESLLEAARRAARGTRGADSHRFLLERENRVLRLQEALRDGSYRPGGYHTFLVTDPKPRVISAASFPDRVVHHALCAEIEPDLERGACSWSFACRKGKGTLAALWHAAALTRRHRYALTLDIRHFFETIDHDVLCELLRVRLRDPALSGLAELFVRAGAPGSPAGRGVPIGNLTSQHFANLYLGPLDRFVMRGLSRTGYVRYMDDLRIFGDSREELWAVFSAVERFVAERLRVALKPSATRLLPVSDGVPFLGWRLFRGVVRLDGARRRRLISRLRRLCRWDAVADPAATVLTASAASVVGWAKWGHTLALRRSLMESHRATGVDGRLTVG